MDIPGGPPLSHETRVPQLLAIYVTSITLTTIVVILRFYTRSRITHFIGADDWWILAALIVGFVQIPLWIAYLHYGNAHHIWDVVPSDLADFFMILWLIQMVYVLGIGLIKMSSLALFLRLFPSDNFRVVIRCSMAFIAVMTLSLFFASLLQCLPIDSNWEFAKFGTRKCIDRAALQVAGSAMAFITDVIVLCLPIKYLLGLRVSTREKVQVILVMSLGAVTCIASIIRFKYIHLMIHSTDSTWDGYWLSLWTCIEFHLGIITTSTPAIKPLWVLLPAKLVKKDVPSANGSTSEAGLVFVTQAKTYSNDIDKERHEMKDTLA